MLPTILIIIAHRGREFRCMGVSKMNINYITDFRPRLQDGRRQAVLVAGHAQGKQTLYVRGGDAKSWPDHAQTVQHVHARGLQTEGETLLLVHLAHALLAAIWFVLRRAQRGLRSHAILVPENRRRLPRASPSPPEPGEFQRAAISRE